MVVVDKALVGKRPVRPSEGVKFTPVNGIEGFFDLRTNHSAPAIDGERVLYTSMPLSLSMFPAGEGQSVFYFELNSHSVVVGPARGAEGWFFVGAPDGAWGMDVLEEAFDMAYVVMPDPDSLITPWVQISDNGLAASWEVVFPLWYDYTKTPPTKMQCAHDFFYEWVAKHGKVFVNNDLANVVE